MESLVQIFKYEIDRRKIDAIDGRELHQKLQVITPFSKWIQRRIVEAQLVIGKDFISMDKNVHREIGSSIRKEYIISLDSAKHISMLERTELGREIRQYFIDYENGKHLEGQEYLEQKMKEIYNRRNFETLKEEVNIRRKELEIREKELYINVVTRYANRLAERGLKDSALAMEANIAEKMGVQDAKKYLPSIREDYFTPMDISKYRKGLSPRLVGKILKKIGLHGTQDSTRKYSTLINHNINGTDRLGYRYQTWILNKVLEYYDKKYNKVEREYYPLFPE